MGAAQNKPSGKDLPPRKKSIPKIRWQQCSIDRFGNWSENHNGTYDDSASNDIPPGNFEIEIQTHRDGNLINHPAYIDQQNISTFRHDNDTYENNTYRPQSKQNNIGDYNYGFAQPDRLLVRRPSLNDDRTPESDQLPQMNFFRFEAQSKQNNIGDYNYGFAQPDRLLVRRPSLNDDRTPESDQLSQSNIGRFEELDTFSFNLNDNINYDWQGLPIKNYSSDRISYWGQTEGFGNEARSSYSDYNGGMHTESNKQNSIGDEDLFGNNIENPYVEPRLTDVSGKTDNIRGNSLLSSQNLNLLMGNNQIDFTACNFKLDSNRSEEDQNNIFKVLQFPSAWSSNSRDTTGFVNVPYSSPEGEKLKRFFNRTSQTKDFQLYIKKIQRVENPFLHTLYLLKKEEMVVRNGHVDELHLFHGMKKGNLHSICNNNLNWRLVSQHMFGKGNSFSPLATYASHYCDNSEVKVMLLCKVLVSNAVVGTVNLEIPPIIDGVTYDTSIKENTSVVVKYCDNEFYPLYKITFTKR